VARTFNPQITQITRITLIRGCDPLIINDAGLKSRATCAGLLVFGLRLVEPTPRRDTGF